MKGKQLLVVLVLLAALGGVALFLNSRSTASWSSASTTSGNKVLDFPLNDVTQATIKDKNAELSLVKKDDVWGVKERADYPADFEKVSALLRKLWELRPVQDVKVGPSQLSRLELTAPGQGPDSGTLIDLKGEGDKRIEGLLLGKKHLRNPDQPPDEGGGMAMGRYVMAEDGSNRVYLVADTFDEIVSTPSQWLSREFIKVDKPKSITVTGTGPGVNYKVIHDGPTSPWKLVDPKPGEELDGSKVAAVSSQFASPSFTDVLPPDAPASETGLDKPSTVQIETFDGFVYDIRIGKLKDQSYPAMISVKADLPKERTPGADEKPEDKAKLDQEFQTKQKQLSDKLAAEQKLSSRTYLLMKPTVEQVLKERTSLMVEKKASPTPGVAAPPAPAKAPSPAPARVPPPKKR
jgi:hypothetical protein